MNKPRKMINGDLPKVQSGELKIVARKSCNRCYGTGFCGIFTDGRSGKKSRLICPCVLVVKAKKEGKLVEQPSL